MPSILEALAGQLGGSNSRQIGRQLGVDEGAASSVIAGALPMIVGALARNTSNDNGAAALGKALDRDHDGSLLDDLGGFLGNQQQQSQGAGILKHVFGERRGNVERSLSRTSGLDRSQVTKILAMLAPLVLAQLGKQKRQQRLDNRGLADILSGEKERMVRKQPELGALGALFDKDHDGNVMDDIAKTGAGMLGKILLGRR